MLSLVAVAGPNADSRRCHCALFAFADQDVSNTELNREERGARITGRDYSQARQESSPSLLRTLRLCFGPNSL